MLRARNEKIPTSLLLFLFPYTSPPPRFWGADTVVTSVQGSADSLDAQKAFSSPHNQTQTVFFLWRLRFRLIWQCLQGIVNFMGILCLRKVKH